MIQDKSCLVAGLGLHEHEIRLVKSILKLSNERDRAHYEWADDVNTAHLVIVCPENVAAVKTWQVIAQNRPSTALLLITPHPPNNSIEYFLSRPISPSKMLTMLDKICKEKLAPMLEQKIFAGEGNSSQRETIRAAQGIVSTVRRALVVDDSPTVRKQLELELSSFNIRVDSAESGERCLEIIEEGRYDIIFLDVVMPGTDGYEVCKSIRKNQMTKHTPVIMLTSKSSSIDRVRGALAGCDAYLTKPVDYEKFHKILHEYLIHPEDEGSA